MFNDEEFEYRLDVEDDLDSEQPRLFEMTETALKILQKCDEGFVLFVEAGHVDKAHHKGWAGKALEEVLELELAVETALNMTDAEETLVLVTADHSHSLTINGYPRTGVDILTYDPGEMSQQVSDDKQPHYYPSLMYSTGPGKRSADYDVSQDDSLSSKDYVHPSLVYQDSASHGGEDVALFATGHNAHIFRGLIDQHQIPHYLSFLTCVGDGITLCN